MEKQTKTKYYFRVAFMCFAWSYQSATQLVVWTAPTLLGALLTEGTGLTDLKCYNGNVIFH